MELKGKIFEFLGDSITEGCGVSSPDKVFHALICKKYGLKRVDNFGIGGTRIARQSEMNDTERDYDFMMRVDALDPKADGVVVFGGTNDFGTGQAPLGEMNDRSLFTFYGAMHNLCRMLIEKYPDGTIVFITPLHRFNEDGWGAWKPEGVKLYPLRYYAKAVKDVCEFYSIPVLDLFSEGELRGNTPEWYKEFMPDGVHPNDKGHEIIARKLGALLEYL